jgi:hypothetical protein
MRKTLLALAFTLSLIAVPTTFAAEGETLKLGEEGKITLESPEGWEKKKPAINFIEYEFAIPKAEGDDKDGRVTLMGAGGSIDANVERWIAQFEVDGKPLTKDKARIDKTKIGGVEVHMIDLSGAYKDQSGGPFAGGKTTLRENYRMLGAIIVGGEQGNYFVKAYGPKKTMDASEEAFKKMIESVKAK